MFIHGNRKGVSGMSKQLELRTTKQKVSFVNYLPDGDFGMKSMVLVFARTYSPVPSIQT
jgi:hypothetical protein